MGQIKITELIDGPSLSERLLGIFLFVSICIILVRMIKLAWRLWCFRSKREFLSDGTGTVEEIAKAVLRGLFEREPKLTHNENISKVDCIDTRFLYLWETCYAQIQSTKSLALLTVILSFSVAVLGCINICDGLVTEESVGIAATAHIGRETLAYLATGLFVSAFFYAISLMFGGILACRRRDWNYLRARIREDFSSKQ